MSRFNTDDAFYEHNRRLAEYGPPIEDDDEVEDDEDDDDEDDES